MESRLPGYLLGQDWRINMFYNVNARYEINTLEIFDQKIIVCAHRDYGAFLF